MICTLLVLTVLVFIISKYLKPSNVEPIFGVYKQPGEWYYLKYVTFWCILNFRRVYGRLGSQLRQTGYGMKSRGTPDAMDVAQKLSSHQEAFDAVFFMATNKDGYYLVGGSERRHGGLVNGLFYLVGEEYLAFLQYRLPELLANVPMELRENMWYQHDGAPAHYSRIVREFLSERFAANWIGRNGPIQWPAGSPDLTPVDFFLWSFIKEQVYSPEPEDQLEVVARVHAAVATIDGAYDEV